MWLLNKAGFVQATRGTKGGYSLARPASEIRLSEVIKVLDADVLDKHCESYTGILDSCVHKGDCGIRPVIVGLHEIVENALSQDHARAARRHGSAVDERFHQIQGIHTATIGSRVELNLKKLELIKNEYSNRNY